MLAYLVPGNTPGSAVHQWFESAAIFIEALAVLIVVASILVALTRYMLHYVIQRRAGDHYHQLKVNLGKALLLGLEILVAADIILTVALEATLQSVLILGLMVLIRTFLSWALVVEIEGRCPWQPELEARRPH